MVKLIEEISQISLGQIVWRQFSAIEPQKGEWSKYRRGQINRITMAAIKEALSAGLLVDPFPALQIMMLLELIG